MESKPPSKRHPIAVGKLLDEPRIAGLSLRSDAAKALARREAQRQRDGDSPSGDPLTGGVERIISEANTITAPGYTRALNATGILLHTGLGRAPLADAAIEAIQNAAAYCQLEIDRESGERGNRWKEVERKLVLLTGAEAALVVNNCASAVLLALSSIAARKEVIVSRSELVEIGGGFRMPDVMARAGVKRVEVGTTNRTRLNDYRNAITPKTAAILKVHPSNYRIVGFAQATPLSELVELSKSSAIPFIEDLGNGLLINLTQFGLPSEPTLLESIEAGVDVVVVSGDKCLGGPQAGILLGKTAYIDTCRRNALLRAVRPDKLTLAALDATLGLWLTKREHEIPFIAMLNQSVIGLRERAQHLVKTLPASFLSEYNVKIVEDEAMIGSGAVPQVSFPDISLSLNSHTESVSRLAKRIRLLPTPVYSVVTSDTIRIHLRTILPRDDFLLGNLLITL